MDAAGWIGIVAPLVSYFGPSRAFVIRAVKSLVASENDLWVDGIHGEHGKADITAAAGAAVGTDRRARRVVIRTNVRSAGATGWYLNPSRSAVHGLVEVMVRVAGPQKIKRGVDHA